MGSDSNLGLLFTIDADSSAAEAKIERFSASAQRAAIRSASAFGDVEEKVTSSAEAARIFSAQVTPNLEQVDRAILNQHQSVHLLAEEMGIRLPRAVVSGISEILPPINLIGPALLGAFAVDMIIKFGEQMVKTAEVLNGVADAEKALAEVSKENAKHMEDMSKASEKYARGQLALLRIQLANTQADIENAEVWIKRGEMMGGWFYDQILKVTGGEKKLQDQRDSLTKTNELYDNIVKIIGQDEVKAREDAEKAAKKAEEAARKAQTAEEQREKRHAETILKQIGLQSRLNQDLQKFARDTEKAMQEEVTAQNRINVADLQFLHILDDIYNAEKRNAALARTAVSGQIANEVIATKHLSLARKELIGITQDLRKVEDAFSEAMKGDVSALASMTQTVGEVGAQFAQAIGGTKAAAAVKGAYDAALSIEYMAQFIASYGTDVDALLASVQYGLAAEEMFKVAGGGGGAKAARGGPGGNQSSYGRGSGGGDRAGSGSGPGGGNGSRGPTIVWNQYGPTVGSQNDFAKSIANTLNQLGRSGQIRLTAYNALTNGAKQT